ncbi:hypothetical protein QQF64_022197 [Cirrhinus molitorella]|uniref:Envelope protein n=1 Tax=Cirrhinus molitorella TaxID=172907 RepID=A0ABR3LB06_9TELE
MADPPKNLACFTSICDFCLFASATRMLLLLTALNLCLTRGLLQPEIVSPGPVSGIVLREQPGLLITNCRTHTQKVYVRLDPRDVYRAHYPRAIPQVSWAGGRWTQTALDHAEANITHMLTQIQKVTVTQADLSGQNRRTKRFLGALLGAAAAVQPGHNQCQCREPGYLAERHCSGPQHPAQVATLTYDQHDTATRINLLNQTMWIQVPKDAILHLDDLALYHLHSEEYHTELEISNFFRDYNFTLSPELEMRIAEGGPQLIDITPFDQALQALDQMPTLANLLVVRSWTAADTALCLTTIIGYALSLCLSFILYKRINGMQELVGRCTAAFPRMFKRHPGKQGAPTEPTLIEIDTLPVHYCTEVE